MATELAKPIPVRVAILEERDRVNATTIQSMDGKLDEILLQLANRQGREGVIKNINNIITVIISGSVAGLITMGHDIFKR